MPNALDTLFQAASGLPDVPGDNQVVASCVANLNYAPSNQGFTAEGLLQFTPAKRIPPGEFEEPAFFTGSVSSTPPDDPNNPSSSLQAQITLTAPRRLPHPVGYSLTVQAPIFSQSITLTPQAILSNGAYIITASSAQQGVYVFLTVFTPFTIND
jgi:hypothetical protein